jgi:hypothetical protein
MLEASFLEGEEVANPQVMGNDEVCSPLIDDDLIALELGSHPLAAHNVGEYGDLLRDGS